MPKGFSTITRRQPFPACRPAPPPRAPPLRVHRPSAGSQGNRARLRRRPVRGVREAAHAAGSSISPDTKYICCCSERITSSLRIDLRKLAEAVLELPSKLLVAHLAARHANHGEPGGQPLTAGKAVDGGEQLALRQIAGRAEDDERRRAGVGSMRRLSRRGLSSGTIEVDDTE